ncbi:hypothetical protein RHGRI_026573 [Rhododendron griersonianum]|uniref:BED-type domain-containing protein n=1 Tax=Rhododendron griersonianum TaxID=479676 RepID=A0AAV6ITX1_9ERIC|nr:hypothetical protein RHGRI_026573 [Rhododendron griersonianum]
MSSCSLPLRQTRSLSAQVESNDMRPPTLGSSQAETEPEELEPETESSIPVIGQVEYNSEGDEVVDTSNLRSVQWQNFQKIKVTMGGKTQYKARCLYCNKKLCAESKSGTTHLKDHSNSCLKKKMVDSKQTFLTPSVMMGAGKSSTLQAYAFNPNHARKQLAHMIIMHEYPLSIVEHLWFKRFCYALQPLFHVVCRNTIKKDILMIYEVERMKTMRLLERNQSRVSFTTDMWTASNQKRGFMVITAHWIDDSWKLQSRIIRFAYVPCPHTAEVLSEVMMDTFLEWNVDRKLSTLTVDNCSTNDAMINLLLEKFGSDHLWFKSFFHVRCAAHILNLIVKDGLDVIKSSIEKVRDSVAYWTATPKREEKFEDAARQLGVFCGKKLSLDCPTRWNSTYLMLLTAIKYRSAFGRLRLKDPQYKCCPNDDDWNMAIDICERLKVFYEVTLLFSGTSYPTSNLFFKSVCEIKMKLSEWVLCENFVVSDMALKMIEKYDKYWENSHGFLGAAAVLDPRFKMSLIEYYYSSIYGERGDEMIESIMRCCFDLLTMYEGKNKNDGTSTSKPPASTTEALQVSSLVTAYAGNGLFVLRFLEFPMLYCSCLFETVFISICNCGCFPWLSADCFHLDLVCNGTMAATVAIFLGIWFVMAA